MDANNGKAPRGKREYVFQLPNGATGKYNETWTKAVNGLFWAIFGDGDSDLDSIDVVLLPKGSEQP